MKDCRGTQVYLDDMIHGTKDLESHAVLLRKVFQTWREHNIYLHPGKCEWAVEKVDFLGMTLSHNRISISGEKSGGATDISSAEEFSGGTKIFGVRKLCTAIYPTFFYES